MAGLQLLFLLLALVSVARISAECELPEPKSTDSVQQFADVVIEKLKCANKDQTKCDTLKGTLIEYTDKYANKRVSFWKNF